MKPGFFEGVSQREIQVSFGSVKSPCCYRDSSTLHAVFTVSTDRVAPLLPDGDLHPLELRKGRALLGVTALEHRESDVGAYRELIAGPLVVFGRRSVRVLDAVAALVRRSVSVHVLHMPVTTEAACAAGVEIFGFPKTVASVEFVPEDGSIRCSVADAGREVLTLVAEDLPPHADRRVRAALFSTKEGALLESVVEMDLLGAGHSFRRDAATLLLGPDHPISTSLASLDLDPSAVLVQRCLRARMILYSPHPAHVPMLRAG